jgi:DivIVA domain-containing protein
MIQSPRAILRNIFGLPWLAWVKRPLTPRSTWSRLTVFIHVVMARTLKAKADTSASAQHGLWITPDANLHGMGDGGLTAEDVRGATFEKPPWGKRGYDEKSVNDFLQLVARRLEGRGHLCADDVRGVSFPKPPFGRRGYNEHDVDALLDEIASTIANLDHRQ